MNTIDDILAAAQALPLSERAKLIPLLSDNLALCQSLVLGLAVWALAPVASEKTEASAQTADWINPILWL